MQAIHFVGANGFPAQTYAHIFKLWEPRSTSYINVVAQDKNQTNSRLWSSIADEIIDNIEAHHTEPVIGIGHSMGASTTLMAAQKRPDLFSKLILIEPIVFKRVIRSLMQLRKLKDSKNGGNPLAAQARERKDEFNSLEQAREYYSQKSLFRHFTQESIEHYIHYGLQRNEPNQPWRLTFPKNTEADIFVQSPFCIKAPKLDLPIHLLIGASSDIFAYMDLKLWRKYLDEKHIIYRPGGHLFPFEEPQHFARLSNAIMNAEHSTLSEYSTQSKRIIPPDDQLNDPQQIVYTVDIDAPARNVFEYFIEGDLRARWINGLRTFNYTQRTPELTHSTFEQRIVSPGQGQYSSGTILACEHAKHLHMDVHNKSFSAQQWINFKPSGGEAQMTQLDIELHFKLNGPVRLIKPLVIDTVSLTFRRQIIENINNLKQLLEP